MPCPMTLEAKPIDIELVAVVIVMRFEFLGLLARVCRFLFSGLVYTYAPRVRYA